MSSIKLDKGKLRWDLVPWKHFEDVVGVISYGAEKYSVNNWQGLEDFDNRFFAASLRHLMAWRQGALIDEESGLPHLAHAICGLLFLMHGKEEVRNCGGKDNERQD